MSPRLWTAALAIADLLCAGADCAAPNCPSNQVPVQDDQGRWSCVDSDAP